MKTYKYGDKSDYTVIVGSQDWAVLNTKMEIVAKGSCLIRKHNLDSGRRKAKQLTAQA